VASFGNLSITLALTFAVYALFALFFGAKTNRRDLVKSGEHSVYVVFLFVTMAVASLVYLLMKSDFSLDYVASFSNRDLNVFYKFAALWGGQKGSLLFWTWILTMYVALTAWINRRYPGKLVPYTLGIATLTSVFFLIINKFGANPFGQLAVDDGSGNLQAFIASDGQLSDTETVTITVIDNDRPVFGTDGSDTSQTTGEDFDFSINVSNRILINQLNF